MKKLVVSLGLAVLAAPAFANNQSTAMDMTELNTMLRSQTCFARDAAGRWYSRGNPGAALQTCHAYTRVGGCYFWGCNENFDDDNN